ncbi:hypothetical protein [Citrobacter braakii]|uniref:hypothetical protein n=1 Tax=Citrobacter braakii TaxID=57706 RepID=UPI00351D3098
MQTSLAYLSLSRHLQASYDPVKQISVLRLTAALPQTAPVKGLRHFSEYEIPQYRYVKNHVIHDKPAPKLVCARLALVPVPVSN